MKKQTTKTFIRINSRRSREKARRICAENNSALTCYYSFRKGYAYLVNTDVLPALKHLPGITKASAQMGWIQCWNTQREDIITHEMETAT